MELASIVRDCNISYHLKRTSFRFNRKKINFNIEVINIVILEKISSKLHLGLVYTNREKFFFDNFDQNLQNSEYLEN